MKKSLLFFLLLSYCTFSYGGDVKKATYFRTDIITTNKIGGVKQYSRISPDLSAGFGYYINDIYRIDLVGGSSAFAPDTSYVPCNEITADSALSGTKRVTHKAQARYFLFSNYIDVVSSDDFKIFLNIGLGGTKIKEKITVLFSGIMINGDTVTIPLNVAQYKSKSTKRLLYSFGVGTGIRVHPKVNVDIAYNYKNFGKPKYKSQDIGEVVAKRYKSHNVSIGVRLDL